MGDHLNEVAWIEKLPSAGGDWGKGIVGTVLACESAIEDVEAHKKELDSQLAAVQAEVKAGKAEADVEIRAKRKLLKATVKRADEEAPMMFGNAQIVSAKKVGEVGDDPGDVADPSRVEPNESDPSRPGSYA